MIGKDEIAAACRAADEDAERGGLPGFAGSHQIHEEGMIYVARQRAFRATYVLAGKPMPEPYKPFVLSEAESEKLPGLMSVWLDGFAVGLLTERTARDSR